MVGARRKGREDAPASVSGAALGPQGQEAPVLSAGNAWCGPHRQQRNDGRFANTHIPRPGGYWGDIGGILPAIGINSGGFS